MKNNLVRADLCVCPKNDEQADLRFCPDNGQTLKIDNGQSHRIAPTKKTNQNQL
jgi:hypothetical protein